MILPIDHSSNKMPQTRLNSTETPWSGKRASSEGRSRVPIEFSRVRGQIEPGQICVYNQNRECFLGMHVVSGDFTAASFTHWLATLTPNSGAGVWLVPFRGIPEVEVCAPLDLLYLDQDSRVIAAVEFFPTYKVPPGAAPASSVLVLPSHSIFSSHTQAGDQLMLCSGDEMEYRLEQLAHQGSKTTGTDSGPAGSVWGPVLVREEPKEAPRPVLVREQPIAKLEPVVVPMPVREEAKPAALPPIPPPQAVQSAQVQTAASREQQKPWAKVDRKPQTRGWLSRLLSPDPPDPRVASRQPVKGLVAHFFTGGAPKAHEIRDVSATGLYVITTERWYPGTIIRMTLTKPDTGQAPSERSITIQAKSVRWGNDGVGLQFIVAPRKSGRGPSSEFEPVDAEQLGAFLGRLGAGIL
jgi:uncharacterized protein